eukprot:TRINITY_DN9851_c0_g2_i8.p1 TRINITY_DN9851_c0_g2~~TRINITY_DN9851_c0_g2_i8.p1  ORF type:complete len:905 (-),score=112.22 TRINITY_DN9851_c0_g2_i8:777-3491(-)
MAKNLEEALKAQNLDRNSPNFGKMKNSADMRLLTQAVKKDGDPALVKRLLLAVANKKITRWGHNFSFDGNEAPAIFPAQSAWLFRSCWWPLNDGGHAGGMLAAKPHLKDVPAEVNAAMKRLFEKWSLARMVMEQGLCSNQWSYDLYHMAEALEYTESEQIKKVLDFQVKRFCTENNLGRSNPDTYTTSFNSQVKYTAAADTGMIGGGVPAEVLGHDSQYSLESTSNMYRVWAKFRHPEILAWLEKYYALKTHMTVSKTANAPTQTFTGTCSPADFNSRTRYYTHKSPIDDAHDLITYGKLWCGQPDNKSWPFLEDGSFVRTIDNTYFFIKTPSYYLVAYGGAGFPPYVLWNAPAFCGNSMSFAGYGNPGYGAYQYMVKKPGGISALWIPGCGPVLMGSNHNVMFTNAVWGKISEPVCKKHKPDVDPYVVSESFAAPQLEFDQNKRVLVKSGVIPYTPLKFRREISMHDDYIAVKLELTSEKDFQFSELYEAIPLFPDNRVITTAQGVLELPPVIITPVNKTSADKKQWGINPDIKPVKTKFISVLANSGKGAFIEFENDVEVTFAQPLKYRREAATMSAASIQLPNKWTKGEKFIFSYLIKVKQFRRNRQNQTRSAFCGKQSGLHKRISADNVERSQRSSSSSKSSKSSKSSSSKSSKSSKSSSSSSSIRSSNSSSSNSSSSNSSSQSSQFSSFFKPIFHLIFCQQVLQTSFLTGGEDYVSLSPLPAKTDRSYKYCSQRRKAVKIYRAVTAGISSGGKPVHSVAHRKIQRKCIFRLLIDSIHAVASGAGDNYFFARTFFFHVNRILYRFVQSLHETVEFAHIGIDPTFERGSGFSGNKHHFADDYAAIPDHGASGLNDDFGDVILKIFMEKAGYFAGISINGIVLINILCRKSAAHIDRFEFYI